MRIYIAGKVTGLPSGDVFTKFGAAEYWLKGLGYEVINPVRLCSSDWPWKRCMRVCITELMKCDAICMLPDWIDSTGAQTEWALACHLGMRIINYRPKSMRFDYQRAKEDNICEIEMGGGCNESL